MTHCTMSECSYMELHLAPQLYGVRHIVKDYSDNEIRTPLLPLHSLLFSISSKGSFICTISDRIAHSKAFVSPVVKHQLEQEIT